MNNYQIAQTQTSNELEKALHELLRDSSILDEIENKCSPFNPFEVLRITHTEIRHSNVLSWLLNPQESHGLGDWFIKYFLVHIALSNDLSGTLPMSGIYSMDLSDARVYREYKHIDIYIESQKNNLKILIENKIYAKEGKKQLTDYKETINNETDIKENVIIPVFLTLEGRDPEGDEEYFSFSHEQIRDLLVEAIKRCENNGKKEAARFIGYYKQNLGDLIMPDAEVVSLCKEIYKKHKTALDAIYENINDSNLDPVLDDFFAKHTELKEIKRKKNSVFFLPENLLNLPDMDHQWDTKKPVGFWISFNRNQDKIYFVFEVGPMDSGAGRSTFVSRLKAKGAKTTKSSLKIGAKYTRIVTSTHSFDEWDNTDEMISKIDSFFTKFMQDASELLNEINTYDWDNWQTNGGKQ